MDPENEEEKEIVEEEAPVPEIEQKVITKPEARYVAYHQEESSGIVDSETNVVIGTEILQILSKILNELDELKKSSG